MSSRRPGHDRRAPSGGGASWAPASLPDLFFYDDNTRTAAWDSTVTTEDLAELTAMAWVYPDDVSGFNGLILGRGDTGAAHWWTDQNGGECRGVTSGGEIGIKASSFAGSTWSHVAWRFYGAGVDNATRLRFWLNGVESAPGSYSGTIPASLTSRAGKKWFVGSLSDGAFGYAFGATGKIAQTIICGSALSEADIVRAYNYTIGRK